MRSLKLASVSALFVVAVSLSAFANSNDSFSNVNLTGVSGTVSGSFVFNSTNDTFSVLPSLLAAMCLGKIRRQTAADTELAHSGFAGTPGKQNYPMGIGFGTQSFSILRPVSIRISEEFTIGRIREALTICRFLKAGRRCPTSCCPDSPSSLEF